VSRRATSVLPFAVGGRGRMSWGTESLATFRRARLVGLGQVRPGAAKMLSETGRLQGSRGWR
jgi:hypothetical protein